MRANLFWIAGAVLLLASPALARQEYNKVFWAMYKDELGKYAETERCNACHYSSDKKNRNDYGQAVGTALGQTQVKKADEIKAALSKAAKKESSTKGKTFGDLIQEGRLPGVKPK